MVSEETGGITAWREQACAFDSKWHVEMGFLKWP